MRTRTLLAACLLLVTMVAAPAAAQPEVQRPQPVEDTFILLECEDPLEVALTGKEGGIFFEDRAILTAPGMRAVVTNTVTGQSLNLSIAGTFHERTVGDTVVITMTGRNLIAGPRIDGQPGVYLTIGRIVGVMTADDPDAIVILEDSPGRMIDLCAALGTRASGSG